VDVLKFNKATQRWSLLEVKSGTKVKAEYLDDAGFQAYVLANSGLPLEQISILHVNRDCVSPDLSTLFTEVDVTQELRDRHKLIGPKLTEIFAGLRSEHVPDGDIGDYCTSGVGCPFQAHCFQEKLIPPVSVFNIPGLRDKAWEFYRAGQVKLEDVDLALLSMEQRRMVEAHLHNDRFIDSAQIAKAMSEWKYPLVFLDFETINPAIPRYLGTRPYQQVPFQFSVHVMRRPLGEPDHFEFLHLGEGDPRVDLVPALLEACGEEGSIVSYFARFESEVIQELAEIYPAHRDELLQLTARMVDPLPIIRASVYDPAFAGRFSLKKVAPALLGETFSYSQMEVADGTAAQRAFDSVYRGRLSLSEVDHLRKAMLEYCKQDTLAMVELVKWLEKH
jgi:hypothetical protein